VSNLKHDWDDTQTSLLIMNSALASHQAAYRAYMICAQAGEWEDAARHAVETTAHLEVAMDAFAAACRIQQRGKPGDA
jgi:hypothetical protein